MRKTVLWLGAVLGLGGPSFFVESASAKPRATRKAAPKKSAPRQNAPGQNARRVMPLPPREIARLNQELRILRSQRAEMLQEYRLDSPEIQILNRRIEAVKRQLRGQADASARTLPPATEPRVQLLGQ